MKYTSAQANKLLKKLNGEYSALLDKERRSRDFRAAKTLTGLSVCLNGARPHTSGEHIYKRLASDMKLK